MLPKQNLFVNFCANHLCCLFVLSFEGAEQEKKQSSETSQDDDR